MKRAPAASCCRVGTAGASPASQAAGHCRKGPPRQRGTLAGLSGLPVARDKEDRWALPPSASITCGIWGKKNKYKVAPIVMGSGVPVARGWCVQWGHADRRVQTFSYEYVLET